MTVKRAMHTRENQAAAHDGMQAWQRFASHLLLLFEGLPLILAPLLSQATCL